MWLFGSKETKENLRDPEALTFFYMDNVMCTDFYLKYNSCMEDWGGKFWRRKQYKECMNHMDQYKACIVGINHEKIAPRRKLSENELTIKRKEAKDKAEAQKGNIKASGKENDEKLIKF